MATHMSAEDVHADFLEKFPPGAGALAHELWTNIGSVHLNWKNYRALFGTSAERIGLLNWAAPSFFAHLDGILRHDVFMAIARLTDPPETSRHPNASLRTLLNNLRASLDPAIFAEMDRSLSELKGYCKPIRDVRDRHIAHDDLATALKYHSEPLAGISRAFVEGALLRIREWFGAIETQYRGSPTAHEYVLSTGDGEYLMSIFASAQAHAREHEIQERAKWTGTSSPQ